MAKHKFCIIVTGCFLAFNVLGQEGGQYGFDLPPNTARLIKVEQLGQDISVTVFSGDRQLSEIDHRVGRTGPEIFLVGPFSESTSLRLEIAPFQDQELPVEHVDLPAEARAVPFLQSLTDASAIVAKSGNELAGLADIYGEIANAELELFGVSAYASYVQATLLNELSAYDEAYAILENRDPASSFGSYSYKFDQLRAEILFARDQYDESRQMFESVLGHIRNLDLPASHVDLDIANILLTYGFTQLLTGSMDEGKTSLDQSLAIGNAYFDAMTLGRVHNNLGGYYSIFRDYSNSVSHFNQAIDFLRGTKANQELIYTLGNLALIYGDMGEYKMARETAHLGLQLAEQRGIYSELSSAYRGITSLYLKLGEYQIAEEFARLAEDFDLNTDRDWRSFVMVSMHAQALQGQGKADAAIDLYKSALSYYLADDSPNRIMTAYQRLVSALLDADEFEQADSYMTRAIAFQAEFPESVRPGNPIVFAELQGQLEIQRRRYQQALDLVLPILEQEYDYVLPEYIRVAVLAMEAYRGLDDMESAIAYGEQALSFIEQVRGQLDFARLGPAWSSETFPVYLKMIDNLMRQFEITGNNFYAERAFEVTETGLAFNLSLQRLLSGQSSSGESDESAALREQLAVLAQARTLSTSGNDKAQLDIDYFRLLERYQASIPVKSSESFVPVIGLQEVIEVMPDDIQLLEIVCVPESHCYRFSINSNGYKAEQIGTFDEIEILSSAVQTEVRDVEGGRTTATRRLGELLYQGLSVDAGRSLKIVANYPLNTVPMAVLELPVEGGNGEPVISTFQVSTLPSVSGYLQAKSSPDNIFEFELSVLADPEFRVSEQMQLAAISLESDSLRGWYDGLSRLPWSALEAKSLANIYTDRPINVMTGERASKANLLDKATRNSRILHIASHGYFNTATPDLVGIATSPQGGDTGFVSLEELMIYPFQAELVVISGCETGLGDQRGGEGMISLARGFLGQGASHVISTLWPVSDRASAEFMKLFYEALHDRELSVAEALQAAQVSLSRIPEYSAPFYWGAYVLISASGT